MTAAAVRGDSGPPVPRAGLVRALEQRYGTRSPRLTPFYETPAKAVYRVEHAAGDPWVLRHYPAERPMERLREQASIMRYVEQHGIPAERVVLTRDGEETTEVDGRGVLVTTLVGGGVPRRTRAVLGRLGESIGKLHALPSGAAEHRALSRRAGAMPREDLAFGRARLERISGTVPRAYRAAYARLVAALEATRDCEDLPPAAHGLLHSDCHLANAAETSAGDVAWFDWDGAGQGPHVAALGLLLYSCAVMSPGEHCLDGRTTHHADVARRVDAVLSGYVRHHALSRAELECLSDAVRFRPAVVAARELSEAIERRAAPDHDGWWGRYAEAEAVAACARHVLS